MSSGSANNSKIFYVGPDNTIKMLEEISRKQKINFKEELYGLGLYTIDLFPFKTTM